MKNNLVRLAVWSVALFALVFASGCSMLSYNASKQEILRERALASGNQSIMRAINSGVDAETAIKAVSLSNGGVGIGVDIANLDILMKHPVRQLGAAILDAGAIYGGYRGIESLNGSSGGSGGDTTHTAGRDVNTINIHGSGNQVDVGDKNQTTNP